MIHGMNDRWRVGISWDDLAAQTDQLQRIAAATGTEPVIWSAGAPPPDIDVLVAGSIPDTVPRETPHLRLIQLTRKPLI